MTDGRHVLMAMFQGGGNIPQLLPIVARLVALGYRVRVLVGPGVRRSRLPVSESLWRSLRATGAQILRLREPDVHPWDAAPSAHGLLFGWTPQAFRSVEQVAHAQLWLPHWAHETAAELRREPADVLVADASDLVGQQAASVAHRHVILLRPEHNVLPCGVGPGTNRLRRTRCLTVSVHPHPAEVVPEARLHKGAGGRVQRLTG